MNAAHASEPWTKLPEIVASCNCLTKTPQVKYHLVTCRYRQIMENATLQPRNCGEDTKRLDWLENVVRNEGGELHLHDNKPSGCLGLTIHDRSLREAIDAAMKGEK